MPRVSVILPVYNVAEFLPKSLDSLLSQSFTDFEVIAVNDATPDASRTILEDYANKDKRIQIIDNQTNMGLSMTRNVGMQKARGKYIYFFDSDDQLDNEYLKQMYEAAENSGADIVYNTNIVKCNIDRSNQSAFLSEYKGSNIGEYIDNARHINDTAAMVWARLYKRQFLEQNKLYYADIRICEDVFYNNVTSVLATKIYSFFGPKYFYIQRDGSITDGIRKCQSHAQHVFSVFIKVFEEYVRRGVLNLYDIKMFQISPYFVVASEELFVAIKDFFIRIEKIHFEIKRNIYNDIEREFFYTIINSKNYDEYRRLKKPQWLIYAFLRMKMGNRLKDRAIASS